MTINKRGFKFFQASSGSAEELNRVQQAVAEAIRRLADDVDVEISGNPGPQGPTGATGAAGADGADGADGVWVGPAVGVVPSGTTIIYHWAGLTENSLTHLANGQGDTNHINVEGAGVNANFPVPFDGTFQTLLIRLSAPYPDAPGTGTNATQIYLRKNGTGNIESPYNTALGMTLGASDIGLQDFSDLTHSVHFTKGDRVGIWCYPTTMGGSMTMPIYVTAVFVAD